MVHWPTVSGQYSLYGIDNNGPNSTANFHGIIGKVKQVYFQSYGLGNGVFLIRPTGIFQTMTDDNGEYSMYVDPEYYDVSFEKIGYQTYVEYDTLALAGVVTPLDAQLREESYPPSFVYAEVNADRY
jgi:hypothetical protein